MKESQILKAYEIARERYAAIGVDTDKAVGELEKQQISLHCWQTDDVIVSHHLLDGDLAGAGALVYNELNKI